jgi:hypothetical protein
MIALLMNDSHIVSISQLKGLLKFTNEVELKGLNKKQSYEWIGKTLGKFKYFSLRKKDRSIIRDYIKAVTGLSQAQVTRLIDRKKKTGRVFVMSQKRYRFKTTYTADDMARLIETDNAHQRLSGPTTKRIFERMFRDFGDERYRGLKDISISHIYNLRERRRYTSHSLTYTKTNPVKIPIGERRRPDPKGKPGYLRIDTVHQGDLDKVKGVYHINIVDEVTQWEIVGCVERISEAYLSPLLESLLKRFPFEIFGFHSDCGGEFINYRVAGLLQKMLVEQTKSRSRHCNDNALVEGKNGSVIRKYFGCSYVPKKYAAEINEFYSKYFNPYLNFHRPCGFSTLYIDQRGKEKKKYDIYLTPYEKLKSLPNPKQYLKKNVSLKCLDMIAANESDNEAASSMQKAKAELFKRFNR